MTAFPAPADLYPDVAAKGSLAAALQAVAAEHGLTLGNVVAHETEPLRHAVVASTTPLRDGLTVSAGHTERRWSIPGWGQGIWLLSGRTPELAEVAKAARAWREGEPVRDIQRFAPFVEPTRLAEAAEQGPAHVVGAEWQWLREDAEESNQPAYRALVEAAYAQPRLRMLYPYTSHWSLRFSTTTGFRFSPDVVCLEAARGRYVVRDSWDGTVLAETTTPEEAVSLAAGHLPTDLGPAVAGPYPYPGFEEDLGADRP